MVPSWRYLGPETEREIAREREERNIRKRKIERERERERRREREKDRDRHIKASTTHTKLINIHTNVWGRRKARSHMYFFAQLRILVSMMWAQKPVDPSVWAQKNKQSFP